MSEENNPLKFVDTLEIGKHIVLFYEDREYARMVEFRFLKNGLLKGESCVYLIHDGDVGFIEYEM